MKNAAKTAHLHVTVSASHTGKLHSGYVLTTYSSPVDSSSV